MRIFRRFKRKILPRRTSRKIFNFLWRVSAPVLLAGGAATIIFGVLRSLRHSPAGDTGNASANQPKGAFTYVIIGLGLAIIGFSLDRMYRQRQGQIDSVFLKELKKKKG